MSSSMFLGCTPPPPPHSPLEVGFVFFLFRYSSSQPYIEKPQNEVHLRIYEITNDFKFTFEVDEDFA